MLVDECVERHRDGWALVDSWGNFAVYPRFPRSIRFSSSYLHDTDLTSFEAAD